MVSLSIWSFFDQNFFTPLTEFFDGLTGWIPTSVSILAIGILAAFIVLAIIGIWT